MGCGCVCEPSVAAEAEAACLSVLALTDPG